MDESMTGGISITRLPTLLSVTNRHVAVRCGQDWGFCSPPRYPEITLDLIHDLLIFRTRRKQIDGMIVYSFNPVLDNTDHTKRYDCSLPSPLSVTQNFGD